MSLLPSNSRPLVTEALVAQGCLTRPLILVDVGARRGIDPRWAGFGTHLRAVGFEPDEQECARLNTAGDAQIHYVARALGRSRAPATFLARHNPDASGVVPFPERFFSRFVMAGHTETVSSEAIEVESLDTIWAALGESRLDVLKIDAEGAEVEILEGARRILGEGRLQAAEIETRFFHFGEVGHFSDVDRLMRVAGLELFDVGLARHSRRALPNGEEVRGTMNYPAWRSGAQVVASDVLFVRDAVLERQGGRAFGPDDVDDLLILAGVFESYMLYDCMAELVVEFTDVLQLRLDVPAVLDLIATSSGSAKSYREHLDASTPETPSGG